MRFQDNPELVAFMRQVYCWFDSFLINIRTIRTHATVKLKILQAAKLMKVLLKNNFKTQKPRDALACISNCCH